MSDSGKNKGPGGGGGGGGHAYLNDAAAYMVMVV